MQKFYPKTPAGIQLLAEGLLALLKSVETRSVGNLASGELEQLALEIDRLRRTLKSREKFFPGIPIVPTPNIEAVTHTTQLLLRSLSELEWKDCPSSSQLSKSLAKVRREISRVLQ